MSEINQKWLSDFIKDIQNWFHERGSNWSEAWSEGLLLIAACEFLIERCWKVAGERSNHQIFGDNKETTPYKSFDICAEKKNGDKIDRILVEIKFLKPPKDSNGHLRKGAAINKSRIEKDVEKLRSVNHRCERIMVVGIHPFVTDGETVITSLTRNKDVKSIISIGADQNDRGQDGANVRIVGFIFSACGAAEHVERISET